MPQAVPLTLNEVRENLSKFSVEWNGADYERGQAQGFWREFFACFGIGGKSAVLYEHQVKKLGGAKGYIDSFIPGKLIVEAKSGGKNLGAAFDQASEYALALTEAERPRYVIVSDFQRFVLTDLSKDKVSEITLGSLASNAEKFRFLMEDAPEEIADEREADRAAAYRVSKLHRMLLDGGLSGEALDVFLTRLLFLFFADDTGLLNVNGSFHRLLKKTPTSVLYGTLSLLFRTLDQDPKKGERPAALDEDIAQFPYINGALFERSGDFPVFDEKTRDLLVECSSLDWSTISPAIFGAMFQGILEGEFKTEGDEPVSRQATRREMGAHYTSERNIMRVIRPLFLDELREEFWAAQGDTTALKSLYDRLPTITFLDPACGCGSFLVVAYRELRRLEMDIIDALLQDKDLSKVDVGAFIRVRVNQMHGIELFDSPAQIAKVALWITDHQMSMEAAARFGSSRRSLPLSVSPTIKVGNALRVPWEEVIPATFCDYVIGNPPFRGKQYQTDDQKADLDVVYGKGKHELIKGRGVLDFVAAWFVKAAQYIEKSSSTARELDLFATDESAWGSRGNDAMIDIDAGWQNWRPTRVGLVTTNSIVQGEQVSVLWDWMLAQGMQITFAHRTFAWANEGKGNAAVHCVIIGFSSEPAEKKRLYFYPDLKGEPVETTPTNISPYLVDAPNVVAVGRTTPLSPVSRLRFGSMANDGGHLLLNAEERAAAIAADAGLEPLIRPFVGAQEMLNGDKRYALWLVDSTPEQRNRPLVIERIKEVRTYREKSRRDTTRKLAATPFLFGEIRQPKTPYLMIPRVSSERRQIIPIAYCGPEIVASEQVFTFPDATLAHFGVLTSTMHNAWVRTVAGRLKSDYRYSAGLVFNTFPWIDLGADLTTIETAAQGVLDARGLYPDSTLATLYDPNLMPVELTKAHAVLDRAVDKHYGYKGEQNDLARVSFLFDLYAAHIARVSTSTPPTDPEDDLA